ncbi:hypothetical protein U1Q18_004344 [Sarracenia purpurea var. burkii]
MDPLIRGRDLNASMTPEFKDTIDHITFGKQPAHGFDIPISYPQANAISTKQKVDALAMTWNQHSLNAESAFVKSLWS